LLEEKVYQVQVGKRDSYSEQMGIQVSWSKIISLCK